jgi:hypothetical protein
MGIRLCRGLRRCSFTPIQVIGLNATVVEKHVLTFIESNSRYHVMIWSILHYFGKAGGRSFVAFVRPSQA